MFPCRLAWEQRQYFLSYSAAGAPSRQRCPGGASGARGWSPAAALPRDSTGPSCCPGLLPELHRQQAQTSSAASSLPCSLQTLWLAHAGLRGAQEQQLNIQVISLPAPTILAGGCGLMAAACTQHVTRTSHGSRQVLSDPFVNSSSNSRDLSQPQGRHTGIPGYPVIPDGFFGGPSGEPGAWQLRH